MNTHDCAIRVENLRKAFGDIKAVQGVSFQVQSGEIFGLLGPNGAGKTTTISMLSTLLRPDDGDAWVMGHSIRRDPLAVKAVLGVVPQEIALYEDLSARENLTFWGKMYGLRGIKLRQRVNEVLELIGLTDRANGRVGTFSGGMKRRVNIGVALLHKPQVIYMDEPTVGIDPQSRRNILDSVVALKNQGMTVLYTTHYMEEAQELCDHIAITDHGQVMACGAHEELVRLVGQQTRLDLTLNVETERVLAAWQTTEGVSRVSVDNGCVTVLANDSNLVLPRLFEAATHLSARITSVDIREPNLEAVFLHLTGRALRDQELLMKAIDIALKDLTRSFRSAFALVFMFGVPLLMTGMFYFMFGNIASDGEFNLPKTKVIIANLDEGGPHFQISTKNTPDGKKVRTMGELVVNILQSKDMADLLQVSFAPSAAAARAAVDGQAAQVAVIVPSDFSRNFADTDQQAAIEFYQDPTLTIGPEIIRSILNRFVDGLGGVKIAVNVFLDEAAPGDYALAGQVVQRYMDLSLMQTTDLAEALLDTRATAAAPKRDENMLLSIIGPIMGGMMIFYAFYTGASTAQSIIKEEEERTLPRLFTTPTPQVVILTGKFLAVFLTVLVQVVVLLIVARLVFGIQWGQPGPVALAAAGIVISAASFGICVNSFIKNTKQGGVLLGPVLAVTGMVGMISTFFQGSPTAAQLGGTVSLLVPQGWAGRGLLQAMNGAPANESALTALALLGWSAAFFIIGVWRFNRRYA